MSENIFDVILVDDSSSPMTTIRNSSDLDSTQTELKSMSTPSMFWRPVYLAQSAWIEHVPFAFWLIENTRPRVFVELGTHYGVSYFAFCQAVQRLGSNTQCFAVDTWKGDEHAGHYGEEVFQQVHRHNEQQYSDFSRIVRSTFDEALKHFEDKSVDLLHIDGLHTIEAVTHDFESWLPKLTDEAVVIMHDTNVRERGFGVFKLLSQLREKYPYFEFSHGHGLGVVGVGKNQKKSMMKLYGATHKQSTQRSICEVFGRLGRACADARNLLQSEEKVKKLGNDIEKNKKQIEELKSLHEKEKGALAEKTSKLNELINRQSLLDEKNSVERGQLIEKIVGLKESKEQLTNKMEKSQLIIEEKETQLKELDLLLSKMRTEKHEMEKILILTESEKEKLQESNKQIFTLERRVEELNKLELGIAGLQAELNNQHAETQDKKQKITELEQAIVQFSEQHKTELQHKEQSISTLEQNISTLEQNISTFEKTVSTLEQTIDQYTKQHDEASAAISAAEHTVNDLRPQLIDEQRKNNQLSIEIDILHKKVSKQDADNKKIIENAQKDIGIRFNEIATLTSMLKAKEQDISIKTAEINRLVSLAQINEQNLSCAKEDADRVTQLLKQQEENFSNLILAEQNEKKNLQAVLEASSIEIQRLLEVVNQKDNHLNDLHQTLDNSKVGENELSKTLDLKILEIDTLCSTLQLKEEQLEELHNVLSMKNLEINELQGKLVDSQTEYQNLHQHLIAFYQSTSWKLTAPIRFLKNSIKK